MRKNILSLSPQLDLDLFGYDQPNENGVFCDCERIKMPSKKWQIAAEIRVAFTAAGWLWGSSSMLEMQGHGCSPNVCNIDHGRVATSRIQAMKQACADIIRQVQGAETAGAKAVQLWAESIMKDAPNVPPR